MAQAEEHGAKVVVGGGRPSGLERGYYFEPTVLDVPDNSNPAAQEEIFGPVLTVIGYSDIDDAVRIANDSPYGLSGQVYGADVATASPWRAGSGPGRSTSTQRCSALTPRAVVTSRAGSAGSGVSRESAPSRRSSTSASENYPHDTVGRSPIMTSIDQNLDWLISVDDHILEPPNLWVDRVAAKDRDRAPHMESIDGMDYWVYDGKKYPSSGLSAVAGKSKEEFSPSPCPIQKCARGAMTPTARIEDMDRAGILASLCFPTITRFCGQLFMEASDREFGFECLQHYNDWIVEEWCAAAPGRYIPLMLIPMWDPAAGGQGDGAHGGQGGHVFRVLREPGADWSSHHSRCGPLLGSGHGDGKRARDGGLHARRLVVDGAPDCPDSPFMANLAWGAIRTSGAMLSWLFSGMFQRYPNLKIALVRG